MACGGRHQRQGAGPAAEVRDPARHTRKQRDQLLRYISTIDRPDKFHETVVRLYLKFANEEIFITCHGRVKRGADEYLMDPQAFLRLAYYMEMLKVKSGIKEGVPKFY